MLTRIKDLLIGPPLSTFQLHEKKLSKIRALARLFICLRVLEQFIGVGTNRVRSHGIQRT
ncbi:MAG: hypothetical protein HGA79_10605 [Anaerolineales bacterium]|nr:hypothetical protein [Anaerolineales bacterium]